MANIKKIKKFTGGSLSNTFLYEDSDKKFVRKSVSLNKHREYGFNRWYSQLKKIQHYHALFPTMFPEILRFGLETDNTAFYDMPYYKDLINAHQFISSSNDHDEIDKFLRILIDKMNLLYQNSFPSDPEAIRLYIKEEITQKLCDCYYNHDFLDFTLEKTILFNGVKAPSLTSQLKTYDDLFTKYYSQTQETLTHGNITLENLMYNPSTNQILFIDLYDENIINTPLCEFSQLLQSCNSKYELYSSGRISINKNKAKCTIQKNTGLDYFDYRLQDYLKTRYSHEEYLCIKLFEISQFIRMLPFKVRYDVTKAKFFYAYASYLFHNLLENNELARDYHV